MFQVGKDGVVYMFWVDVYAFHADKLSFGEIAIDRVPLADCLTGCVRFDRCYHFGAIVGRHWFTKAPV